MINFKKLDKVFITEMHRWGIPALRTMLGIVFLWFGLLKLAGVSPVAELVAKSYAFLPEPAFVNILGVWEVLIGLGLIFKVALRITLALLWLQMAGALTAAVLEPAIFFSGMNPFVLTLNGEFIVKNFVLIAAGLVIGGYEVK